ncbi:MAG: symmetrical bis(5'-nucleosyl)-tetraphosphatase [Burkholderiales bacterium]|nr:symmetrical bis(5'-nucleosyl)-tetraphosphatase [Burkholderiales bacterium]
MPTYAIGDVQGCSHELEALVDLIGFDPARDRLWFVGDLVNRGPDSLGVLRFVKSLGEAAVTVLGNHDLHLLMVGDGLEKLHRSDTIQDVLAAPDRDELLQWLRHRPLLHVENDHVLVHAGLLPAWSVEKACALAGEAEKALRGSNCLDFMAHMYGNKPASWEDGLDGYARLRVVINAMTRMRFCSSDGAMEFAHKGGLDKTPEGYMPWFDVPQPSWAGARIVFGHWSALGLMVSENLMALDTGCLWGGALSAVRLEDRRVFQVSCRAWADLVLPQ